MASWQDLSTAEPDFAARVQALFDARTHKILATLRKDGSPRLSGIETTFDDGNIWIGSMPGSRKSADLARDPRLAILVSSDDPSHDTPGAWPGDATIYGLAQLVKDPDRLRAISGSTDAAVDQPTETDHARDDSGGTLYRINLTKVVLTRVAPTNDHLIIESWTPTRGYRKTTRR